MSSYNQKEVYYRQIGDIPNSDTEPFIIIPNRISRSDISHIQRALSNKKTKQLYLTDINNERLKELDLKENTDEIFLHDFQNISSEDLKSLIKNQIFEGASCYFFTGQLQRTQGSKLSFSIQTDQEDLGIRIAYYSVVYRETIRDKIIHREQ